jgi:hypothetical protein
MATTTNYGWTTPDDTALVKDGAAAIRTLGSSVDTTTKALNPETTLGDIAYRSSTANVNTRLPLGTAGQVLKVNSGATAPEWATDASGMTNPMTTTGDTIYSSSGSTPARLGIGTAGQVLQVNSGATAPEWATPASGGMTLLTSGALSGSSTVFSFTSTGYINIQIHFKNVWLNSGANGIKMRINADTGNNYGQGRYQLSPTIDGGNQVTDHFLLTFRANGGSQAFYKNGHGIVTLYRPTDTDVIYMIGDCSGTDSVSSGDTWYNHIIGIYDCSAAVSSITLFPNANDFANGNAYVYGVK